MALLPQTVDSRRFLQVLKKRDTIDVIVGRNSKKKTWVVSEHALCYESRTFQQIWSILAGAGRPPRVTLQHDDPVIFGMFLVFAYTGVLKVPRSWNDRKWASLWVFGERWQAPNFQNCVIKDLQRWYFQTKRRISADCIEYAYRSTPPGSELRRLVAWRVSKVFDKIVAEGRPWLRLCNKCPELPHDFLLAMQFRRTLPAPTRLGEAFAQEWGRRDFMKSVVPLDGAYWPPSRTRAPLGDATPASSQDEGEATSE
ncbi:MAG: hypothetical protein M1833_002149 [Piccolia ochrophora]|nr:MAG: hypothetical protein M1833_002149 [Piccolia ochrophora]